MGTKYILGVLLLILYNNFDSTKSDEVSDLKSKIEFQAKEAQHYVPRVDNSDIFTESLTETSAYYGSFDFIVVGAGSAGAIVAKRLSEYKFKTLLLEAGGKQNNISDIPALWRCMMKSDSNWGYRTVPQKHICLALPNQQCSYPRGFSLGGTSSMNALVYARGNAFDQDHWADFGVSGWSWKDTLPYFKKLENYQAIYGDPGYHGHKGPVTMEYLTPKYPLVDTFLNANAEFHRVAKDYNGVDPLGAAKIHMTKKNGRRMSTNRAYLSDYNPKYLTIETNAYVHKIVIKDKRAVGVEFIQNNYKNFIVEAKREVILSGGSINTPQILMLSGIGPKEELAKHNIPLIVDLPVGKHLEDHVGLFSNSFQSNLTTWEPSKTLEEHISDYLGGTGKLASSNFDLISFITTEGNDTFPDVEFIVDPISQPFISDTDKTRVINKQISGIFQIYILLLHPRSKGTITLKSSNPKDFPLIDLNSLSDPHDVETLYKSFDYLAKLEETKAFKAIDAKLLKIYVPSCSAQFKEDTKDYRYCLIKMLGHTIFHASGSCRIGQKGSSVVDSKLRVYGIKGLRVADCSIIPKTNSGHTHALAMMIGEKAADIIKDDYYAFNVKNLFDWLSLMFTILIGKIFR